MVYDTGIVGLDPKIIQLLGRLRFRTSYGQNVLLHSLEVSHLAAALASEVGANARIAQKAGLLHDIGKAVDHQVQGSHTDIGIKILEKFDKIYCYSLQNQQQAYSPVLFLLKPFMDFGCRNYTCERNKINPKASDLALCCSKKCKNDYCKE